MPTLELITDQRAERCGICQSFTGYRYRLDAETLLIACSRLHAEKLCERWFGVQAEATAEPARPTLRRYRNAPIPKPSSDAATNARLRHGRVTLIAPGTRFPNSHLTFIARTEVRSGNPYANFQCDCGNVTEKALAAVKAGKVISCGHRCPYSTSRWRKASEIAAQV